MTLEPEHMSDLDLIRRTLAPKATDAELELFAAQAARTGLDPFSRQIMLVPRKQKLNDAWVDTHQTMVSIDGARLIAQRSAKYRGQLAAEWCGADGEWRNVWLSNDPPAAARVAVIHADYPDHPVWGVARYGAYVQTIRDGSPNSTWSRMPDVMLAKCAEMLALRKAFQQDLSGLIIEEESGTDPVILSPPEVAAFLNSGPPGAADRMPRVRISREERKTIDDARTRAALTTTETKRLLERVAGVTNSQDVYADQLPDIIAAISEAGGGSAENDDAGAAEVVDDAQLEIDA